MPTDPKDPGKIVYHTRSPESIRKEMQSNRSKGVFSNPRKKRSYLFLFFSFLLIIGSLAGIYFFRGTFPVASDFTEMVDALMLRISAQTVYDFGDPTDILVRVSNSLSRSNTFEIQNFSFTIRNDQGKEVFLFRYPFPTKVELDRYDSRTIYDFRRENPNFSFEGGNYTAHVSITITGKEIQLKKGFEITEKVLQEVYLNDDFLKPSQPLEPLLRIGNHTSQTQSFLLGDYRYYLSKDDQSFPVVTGSMHRSEYAYEPGEKMDFPLVRTDAPERPGIYHLHYVMMINDSIVEGDFPFEVHEPSADDEISRLRIRSYYVNTIPVNEQWSIEVLLSSAVDRPVYVPITGFEFVVSTDAMEIFRYESDRQLNITVPAYSNRSVFFSQEWRQLAFFSEGTYQLHARIRVGDHLITFESKLFVVALGN